MDYTKLSKEISYALRHAPWEYELELDEEGFVPVEQLIHAADSEQFYTRFNSELGMNLQAPLQQCTGKTLYLGCDSDGNSLDGWIRHLVIYDRHVTEDEAIFLNGDDIRG